MQDSEYYVIIAIFLIRGICLSLYMQAKDDDDDDNDDELEFDSALLQIINCYCSSGRDH